jgi:hypothetical protein
MLTARPAGREDGEAWLPLVVDCGVCETTHALDGRGCPFEGSRRALLAARRDGGVGARSGDHAVLALDIRDGGTEPLVGAPRS